jgi:predicted TIM-barrel fold metal-dependent hydrolase
MITDCHTHINFPGRNIDESEHLAASETVGECIVLAYPDGSSEQVNKKVSDYVVKYKDKMTGFGLVEPVKDNVGIKAVGALRDKLGLSGLVLYCSHCGFHPCDSRAMRLYESAQELGLAVFFHNSGELGPAAVLDYAQPYLLDEVARTFGDLKIVVGNMGGPFVDQTLSLIAKHENVYADLTINPQRVWRVYNMVVSANENGVMDKLLFGSGFPSGNASECIEALLGFNKLLGDTSLPTVPRGSIQKIIERDSLAALGISRTD